MVHLENCYCSTIETFELKTKVSFIMYKKERFLPSNTANLALNCLTNSKVFYRGYQNQPLKESFLEQNDYHPLFLYPDEDSEILSLDMLENIQLPINLIIPDGTWRQAQKVSQREKVLGQVQKVKLPPLPKSIYPLRRQKLENGVCTFEAMAYSLGMIEGLNAQKNLMKNFDKMIAAHLINRVILEKEKPLKKEARSIKNIS